MKAAEIRNMTAAELELKVISMKEQLFKLRAESANGRVERPNRFRLLKRDIARCCTVMNEKTKDSVAGLQK